MDQREAKREEILKAALRVYAEVGCERAKIGDIARAAGIGKGTVYEYFTGKEALFTAAITYGLGLFQVQLAVALQAGGSTREKLQEYSRFHTRFLREHIDMIQTFVQIHLLSRETQRWLLTQRQQVLQLIEDVLRAGIARGELRAGLDVSLAALCVVGSVVQYSTRQTLAVPSVDGAEGHAAIIDLLLTGMLA